MSAAVAASNFTCLNADYREPPLDTGVLGRVAGPTEEQLAGMQKAPYVFHARGGKLTRHAVEKIVLPRDPAGNAQGMSLSMSDEGTLWADTGGLLHKSADGGCTWQTHEDAAGGQQCYWLAGRSGSLVCFTVDQGNNIAGPVTVWLSNDEGLSRVQLSEIQVDPSGTPHADPLSRHAEVGMHRTSDGKLFFGMDFRTADVVHEKDAAGIDRWKLRNDGSFGVYIWRSDDGGETWHGPCATPLVWGTEGAITRLPSGRLLAAIRYQRPVVPDDPPNIMEIAHAAPDNSFPFKHVFLVESDDDGGTWHSYRRLVTHHGQTWGAPTALADGTVLVTHDTRYGPGPQSGRTMVSRDDGKTWEDEVYYLYYGKAVSAYNRTVVLSDGTLVTLCGTCDRPAAATTWDAMVGHCDHTVIRWKPSPPLPHPALYAHTDGQYGNSTEAAARPGVRSSPEEP